MKRILFTLLFCLSIGLLFGQVEGDYRTFGPGNWNIANRWQVFYLGGWRSLNTSSAGPFQNIIPSSSSGAITIRHDLTTVGTVTINQAVLEAPAQLRVPTSSTLRIVDDFTSTPLQINSDAVLVNMGTVNLQSNLFSTPCQVFGQIVNSGSIVISNGALLLFNNDSRYIHATATGGRVPSATWESNSTCLINGLTNPNPAPPTNLSQSFGNFAWDTPLMGATSTFSLSGALTTVNGSLILANTGGREVRLSSGLPGYTLNVAGNLSVQLGNFTLARAQSSITTINIGGDFVMTSGHLTLGTSNNTVINVLLNGNFQKSGGVLERGTGTGAGAGVIRFAGGTTQTYSNDTDITSAIHFTVQNGSTLDFGTTFLSGTGSFTVYSGSTIHVGSTDPGGAVQVGTAGGNIRVSGVRTFESGSTVIYNGAGPQFMASGHPAGANTILDNPGGITLVSDATVGGTFTIAQGVFNAGTSNDLTINRNLEVNSTFEPGDGVVIFGGTAAQSILGTGNIAFFDVTLNQTGVSTLDILTNISVENNLAINSQTTLEAGNNLLTLVSTPTQTANVNPLATGASIVGSVIVQRHLPKAVARAGYYHVASPVINTTFTDWGLEAPIAAAYRYDEPTSDFESVSVASSIQNGLGYAIEVPSTGTFTYDSRGTLKQGSIVIPLTSPTADETSPQGWNLLGNPYPSAIDWDNIVLPGNVYDAVYTTDNYNNSGQETGGATTFAVAYVDGVGTPAGYGGEIAQGQAFWVKALGNGNLTISESAKILPTNVEFYRTKEIPNILRITLNGQDLKDEAVVRLRDGATNGFDAKYDAYKYFKGDISLSTLTSDNIQAVINAFGTTDCDIAIPLVTEGIITGNYSLNFVGMESFAEGVSISLKDVLENKIVDVRNEQSYSFTITDKNATSASTRFQILIGNGEKPVAIEVSAVGETLCEDKDVALITLEKSEPGVQYSAEWRGEIVSEPIEGTGAPIQLSVKASTLELGENKITVRVQSGTCSTPALGEQPIITKIKRPQITASQVVTICNEGQATLVASGANEDGWYRWYEGEDDLEPIEHQDGAEFITPSLTKSKTYYVSAVNALGCEGNRVAVKADISLLDSEQLAMTVEGSTLFVNVPGDKQWYLNNELLSGATSDTLEALKPGLYSLNLTRGNCSTVLYHEISEDGLFGSSLINIYPNPTQDKVFIKIKSSNGNATATMVSAAGVLMEAKALIGENGIKAAEFDLLPYANGIYNVRITDGHKVYIKKIAKVK